MGCTGGRHLTPHPPELPPQPVSGIDLLLHPNHIGQPQCQQGDVTPFTGLLGYNQGSIAAQSPAKLIFFTNVILALTPATASISG